VLDRRSVRICRHDPPYGEAFGSRLRVLTVSRRRVFPEIQLPVYGVPGNSIAVITPGAA
jgi:hypothetical protein